MDDVTIHEDEHGHVIVRAPGITWRDDTWAHTDDGYRITLSSPENGSVLVILIEPPWHKPFYRAFYGPKGGGVIDASREIDRLLSQHRAKYPQPKRPNSQGCVRRH